MKRLSAFPCVLAFVVLVALSVTGCGVAAQDPKAPVGFTTSQTYITIENRSGNALAEGLIELVPSGVLAPFRRELPRVESGAKRDVSYRPVLRRRRFPLPPGRHTHQVGQDHGQGCVREDVQGGGAVQLNHLIQNAECRHCGSSWILNSAF